jgi:hypothetical protein
MNGSFFVELASIAFEVILSNVEDMDEFVFILGVKYEW